MPTGLNDWRLPASLQLAGGSTFMVSQPGLTDGTGATIAATGSHMILLYPFTTGQNTMSVTAILVRQVDNSSNHVSLGIYNTTNNTNLYPTSLAASTQQQTLNGGVVLGVFSVAATLIPNAFYWLASHVEYSRNFTANGGNGFYPVLGQASGAFVAGPLGLLSHSYGFPSGLPDPFPTTVGCARQALYWVGITVT